MNIITDVNNLTKTVGDSIKEFFTSVVVNIGTPVARGRFIATRLLESN